MEGTCWQHLACTVLTGSRLSLALYIVRSGLLFPVVPGIACSLNFVPKLGGTACTILSRVPAPVIGAVVQHVCEDFRQPSTHTTLSGGDSLATSGLYSSHGQQIEYCLVYKSILRESRKCPSICKERGFWVLSHRVKCPPLVC